MTYQLMRPLKLTLSALTLAMLAATGCRQKQQTDTGKTYTSNQKAAPPSSDSQDKGPLDSPADTTNGKKSQASDNGSSSATHGQVVAQPGAPPEHQSPHRR